MSIDIIGQCITADLPFRPKYEDPDGITLGYRGPDLSRHKRIAFSKEVLESALKTLINKPLNFSHSTTLSIGKINDAYFINKNLIIHGTLFSSLEREYHYYGLSVEISGIRVIQGHIIGAKSIEYFRGVAISPLDTCALSNTWIKPLTAENQLERSK